MFSSRISTPRWRAKMLQLFERGERRVDLAHVELFAADAHVLDQVLNGIDLGDLDRALDLIHHAQARRPSPAR